MKEEEVVEALMDMVDEERAAVVEFLATHGCHELARDILSGAHHRTDGHE